MSVQATPFTSSSSPVYLVPDRPCVLCAQDGNSSPIMEGLRSIWPVVSTDGRLVLILRGTCIRCGAQFADTVLASS